MVKNSSTRFTVKREVTCPTSPIPIGCNIELSCSIASIFKYTVLDLNKTHKDSLEISHVPYTQFLLLLTNEPIPIHNY